MIAPWVTQFVVVSMIALYLVLTILDAFDLVERPQDLIDFTKLCLAAALGIDIMGRVRMALAVWREKQLVKNKQGENDDPRLHDKSSD